MTSRTVVVVVVAFSRHHRPASQPRSRRRVTMAGAEERVRSREAAIIPVYDRRGCKKKWRRRHPCCVFGSVAI